MIGVKQTGMWYSDNPKNLKKEINDYLNQTDLKSNKDIIALISPHAGFVYSGENAAYAYSQIKGNNYDKVILIGPSHYYPLQNQIAIPDVDTYQTVLGTIPIDTKVINKLSKSSFFIKNNEPFFKEHSTDNQVPFLQEALKDFKIIPMIMGQFTNDKIIELSKIIKPYIDEKTLIVISSDFTHYGSNFGFTPFTKDIKKNLKELNYTSAKYIIDLNKQGFQDHIQKTNDTICGAMPIMLLQNILPSSSQGSILNYSTSSDKAGDYSTTVSYLSISFKGKWGNQKETTMTFTEQEKKDLLKLARTVLTNYVKNGKIIDIKKAEINVTDSMKQMAGGFVTLHLDKNLRGCIGEILPSRSILEVVKTRAISAGTEDPRFPPVTIQELEKLNIEISILTPPLEINSYKDFIIGKHGIILEKNGRSAVFLPQVATEQGWDQETTLTHLSIKAGLPADVWKENTNFQVFEAIVFSE